MLIDSHCHLDFPDFAEELDEVLARARAAGVERFVSICTYVEKLPQILTIAEKYEDVFCSVGTHPHNADGELHVTSSQLVNLASHPKVIAIGEAGLDYHYDKSSRDGQRQSFRQHIAAARQSGLPLVIHARAADDDMISILQEEKRAGDFTAILHCYSSGEELAKVGVDLGCYFSFSGIVTFKNSQELRDIACSIPRDRILVETDAPYLAPVPHRGKRNEPSFVADTARSLATTLGIPIEELHETTGQNFFRAFSKMPKPK